MLLERQVNRTKFDREVSKLEEQRPLLISQGCFVIRTNFPEIDVLLVGTRPAAVQFPRVRASEIILPTGQTAIEYVNFDAANAVGRAVAVRLSLDDFDLLPPSISFRDPLNWAEALPDGRAPAGVNIVEGRRLRVVQPNHPRTRLPFLCVRGCREYHEHPQHDGDDWLLYRGQMGIVDIIAMIWRCCVVNVRPLIRLLPDGKQVFLDSQG